MNSWEAQYQLGLVQKALGRHSQEAIKSLERTLTLQPQHLPALVNLTLWRR